MTEPEPPAEPADESGAAQQPAPDPFAGPEWSNRRRTRHRSSRSSTSSPAPKPAAGPKGERVRVRQRINLRVLRRRRNLGIVMMIAGAVIVGGIAWLAYSGLQARTELNAVKSGVATMRGQIADGNLDGARRTAKSLADHAHRAHELTDDAVWSVAGSLPGGQPFDTVSQIAAQADVLAADVLPPLVDATESLDPKTLRRADGSIDIARIAKVTPVLDDARVDLTAATRAIANTPSETWLGTVDDARRNLLGQFDELNKTLRSADLASRIAPPLLGADGTKRYFVVFQNNAEARGTGGLPGAFAILRVTNGKFAFERFESDSALDVVPTNLNFGPGYAKLWSGARTTSLYRNGNLSPHFPYAAQIWQAMWRKQSGQQLDGAIAVDPEALSYLLGVTGPVTLADGTRVSADNVVSLTQSTAYTRFGTRQAERKKFLLDLASDVSEHILKSAASPVALVKAGGRAAGERRLLVYSDQPAVQRDIEQTSLSGVLPETTAPFVGFSVVNNGGNKLDYYLNREVTYTQQGCGSGRTATASIKLTNNAPAGLSKYVRERTDIRNYKIKPGDNSLLLTYYATDGSYLRGVTVDGKTVAVRASTDRGHPAYQLEIEVPRGQSRTLTFLLLEPTGRGTPVVLQQPLVRPMTVKVDDGDCR